MLDQLNFDLTFGLPKELVSTILVIVISEVIYLFFKNILKKIFTLRVKHLDIRKGKTIVSVAINILKYFIIIIDLMIILEIFGISTKGFIASLGVVSLVAGLAVQDILKDMLSGLTILMENQYAIGDWVSISGFKGEVISLGLRSTKIRAYTGEVKIIANRSILEVINYSIEKALAMVSFQISNGSDFDKVEEILHNLCSNLSNELPKINGKVELWTKTNIFPAGVEYTIVVETKYSNRIETERKIRTATLKELKKNKIKMPYDQVVLKNA